MENTVSDLNTRFAMANWLAFEDDGTGLPVAQITTPQASARVALHGAQLLAWQPIGHQPVLWVSKAAVFELGKSVRGGVPVCWPWFGAKDGKTAHGFVRTLMWQVVGVSVDTASQLVLRLGLSADSSTRSVWEHEFDLELVLTVGATLSIALTTRNTGATGFIVTEALHTYFCVGEIGQCRVLGLEDTEYLDKVKHFARSRQNGAVEISGETDRIYINTQADCLIEDQALGRTIRVAKTGSCATVVWNPWREREKTISDMASDEFLSMLCVETANAGTDSISIDPGEMHTMTMCISVA